LFPDTLVRDSCKPSYFQYLHIIFLKGLPKIHEHDGSDLKHWNFHEGRLVLLFTFRESDLGDGWGGPGIYNDPPGAQKALDMGANIKYDVFST
jgi:hypothetical protein